MARRSGIVDTREHAHRVERAAKHYALWHQKDVDKIVEYGDLVLPETLEPIGKAHRVLYDSDKWYEDGRWQLYEHFFGTPTVYVGAEGGSVCTKRFLKLPSLDVEVAWAPLAETVELDVRERGKQKLSSLRFSERPLLCAVDLRTIVILANPVIFIRGGEMVVTERGIVK